MITTVMEYLKTTSNATPFLGNATVPVAVVDREFQNMLTNFIKYNYYDDIFRKIISNNDDEQEAMQDIINICDNVYLTHAYEYQKLFETTQLEYNPIENYDMKENGKDTNSGNDKTTHSGTDTTTVNRDAHEDSETLGDTSVTDVWGKQETSYDNTQQRAPFESQNYNNLEKGFSGETRESVTDKHTSLEVINHYNKGAQKDTNKIDHGHVENLQHGHVLVHELSRHGNIGVTTTQQMGEQERQFVRFNLVRIVANDLMQELCLGFWGVIT